MTSSWVLKQSNGWSAISSSIRKSRPSDSDPLEAVSGLSENIKINNYLLGVGMEICLNKIKDFITEVLERSIEIRKI